MTTNWFREIIDTVHKKYLRTLHFRFELGQTRFLKHSWLRNSRGKHMQINYSSERLFQTKKEKQENSLTFCISILETKEWPTFSKVLFRTLVMTAVIASACLDGTPLASKPLTYGNIICLTSQTTKATFESNKKVIEIYQRKCVDEERAL